MAETRLTTEATEGPGGVAGLWPFPGIFLLLVFGAWLFYMGSIAGMEDVSTAFYGLGGVTALLVLLALRAMAAGRVRRRTAMPRTARRRRRHAGRAGAARAEFGDDATAMPRRSAIVDEGAAPVEGAIYPGASSGSGAPLNTRMRARPEELRAAPLGADDGEEGETHRRGRKIEPIDATFETSYGDVERPDPSEGRSPVAAEPLPARGDEAGPNGEVWATLRQLEAWINRERAERGAQVARLEALFKAEAVRTTDRTRGDEPANGAAATVDTTSLVAAVDALGARLATLEEQAEASAVVLAGDGDRRIAQLNSAEAGQLLQRIREMVDKRIAESLKPAATLRHSLNPGTASGGAEGDGGIGERIAAAHAAIEASNEAAQAEREAIRAELERLQRAVQRASNAATQTRRSVGEFAAGESTVAEQIAEIRAALGGTGTAGGAPPLMPAAVESRLTELVREVDELRGNLGATTQHVARMGEHYQDLLARLDRLGEHIAPENRLAAGGNAAVQGEVDALRDALTTIIEQNREIRAQQDRLSARLETPRSSEG